MQKTRERGRENVENEGEGENNFMGKKVALGTCEKKTNEDVSIKEEKYANLPKKEAESRRTSWPSVKITRPLAKRFCSLHAKSKNVSESSWNIVKVCALRLRRMMHSMRPNSQGTDLPVCIHRSQGRAGCVYTLVMNAISF